MESSNEMDLTQTQTTSGESPDLASVISENSASSWSETETKTGNCIGSHITFQQTKKCGVPRCHMEVQKDCLWKECKLCLDKVPPTSLVACETCGKKACVVCIMRGISVLKRQGFLHHKGLPCSFCRAKWPTSALEYFDIIHEAHLEQIQFELWKPKKEKRKSIQQPPRPNPIRTRLLEQYGFAHMVGLNLLSDEEGPQYPAAFIPPHYPGAFIAPTPSFFYPGFSIPSSVPQEEADSERSRAAQPPILFRSYFGRGAAIRRQNTPSSSFPILYHSEPSVSGLPSVSIPVDRNQRKKKPTDCGIPNCLLEKRNSDASEQREICPVCTEKKLLVSFCAFCEELTCISCAYTWFWMEHKKQKRSRFEQSFTCISCPMKLGTSAVRYIRLLSRNPHRKKLPTEPQDIEEESAAPENLEELECGGREGVSEDEETSTESAGRRRSCDLMSTLSN